jgi:hypothetical protein
VTIINGQFIWWHVVDGVAIAVPDSPEVSAAIDSGTMRDVYGSIEGAIIHGGVIATAFESKTERTYDALAWLKTGDMIPMGEITTITIKATREA